MKLYDCEPAPNPRRARIFIAEKGLDIPTVQVDLMGKEQLTDEFKALNPQCTVPVLELDDGTCLTNFLSIAHYLEALHPEPPLLGTDPLQQAIVLNWHCRMELDGILAVGESFRNFTKGFKGRGLTGSLDYDQIPALVDRGRARAEAFFSFLDERFGESEYIAGDDYSMADITAMVAVDFASWIKLPIGEDQSHLKRWHDTVSARPSAKA